MTYSFVFCYYNVYTLAITLTNRKLDEGVSLTKMQHQACLVLLLLLFLLQTQYHAGIQPTHLLRRRE